MKRRGALRDFVASVLPRGAVFISYRQSDGTPFAETLAWLLRAAGLPVWRDREDLPPGDTSRRLDEALKAGVSAALLLITPEIKSSKVVRKVELPRLLSLEQDPDFMLAIGTAARRPDGGLDYSAPASLLGRGARDLERFKQSAADTEEGRRALVLALLLHRVRRRPARAGSLLTIDVQSRSDPHAGDLSKSDLTIRLRPPATGRLPDPIGLRDLKFGLALLPQAVAVASTNVVQVSGGAHLSVALALGAALPETLVGHVDVQDVRGAMWHGGSISQRAGGDMVVEVPTGVTAQPGLVPHGHVLVYLDLLEGRSDAAYTRLLAERAGEFDAWVHLRPAHSGPLHPATGDRLVAEVAQKIRDLSGAYANAEVHLLLHCPFAVAVLLGRLLNTLRVYAYEWDNGDDDGRPGGSARYVPALRLRPSDAGGPIEAVLLT